MSDAAISKAGQGKITLIGPVLPFRGGIAQHTTMLRRTLAERCKLQTISFRRQYPKWIFPGASDRDPQYIEHTEPDVAYVIDSLNPWTWMRAVATIRKQRHGSPCLIPWWTVFLAPCIAYIARQLAADNSTVVFICHNVVDHEESWWKSVITKRVLRHGSSFIVHTREDRRRLLELLGNVSVRVCPHPIYSQFQSSSVELPRRGELELLFFGFVRRYKGLDVLLEALSQTRRHDVFLRVVGEFWESEAEYQKLIKEYDLLDRVEVVADYVSEDKAAAYFRRADFVVLPYRSATGSGVIGLAYNFDKPVIVTNVGGLPDVVLDGETGFVIEPDSPEELASTIDNVTAMMASEMASTVDGFKQTMSWDAFADACVESCGARHVCA